MTQYQKEIGVVIVLLAFFLGYFCFVETVPTEIKGRRMWTVKKEIQKNENESRCSFSRPLEF